ncbi:MAG: hypothetical protein ACOCV2_04515 [Persicimonas sp.]
MKRSSPIKTFLAESGFWTLSNAVCVLTPVAATYVALHMVLGAPMSKVSLAMSAVALLTLTWGSWASLIWSTHRLLRASMRLMTVLPGVLLIALAGFGFYIGKGSILFWSALLTSGLGTVACSFMLAGRLSAKSSIKSAGGYLAGLGLFPLLSTVGAGGVAYLWYLFVSNPLQTDWRVLFSFSFFFVTTLAIVLITTVIPAVTTHLARGLVAGTARD